MAVATPPPNSEHPMTVAQREAVLSSSDAWAATPKNKWNQEGSASRSPVTLNDTTEPMDMEVDKHELGETEGRQEDTKWEAVTPCQSSSHRPRPTRGRRTRKMQPPSQHLQSSRLVESAQEKRCKTGTGTRLACMRADGHGRAFMEDMEAQVPLKDVGCRQRLRLAAQWAPGHTASVKKVQ